VTRIGEIGTTLALTALTTRHPSIHKS
jgi:hypothetical protein